MNLYNVKLRSRMIFFFVALLYLAFIEILFAPISLISPRSSRQPGGIEVEVQKPSLTAEYNPESLGKSRTKQLHTENKKERDGNGENKGSKDKDKPGKSRGGPKGVDSFKNDFPVGKEWYGLLDRLEKNTDFSSVYPEKFDVKSNRFNKAPLSYQQRDRLYEDIVIKDVFPTLDNIEKHFEELIKEAPVVLEKYLQRNKIIDAYRDWHHGSRIVNITEVRIVKDKIAKRKDILNFPKESRKKFFDKTIQDSKEVQLDNFIRNYMGYNPNKGDLPIALRELFFENLLRVVYPFSNDPIFFILDYFQENLNKEDYLRKSFYQLSLLYNTKTGIEILFTLDNIYRTQKRAWAEYFKFENIYKAIPPTRRKTLHVETIHRVNQRYKPTLKKKKIKNKRDIDKLYLKKRLEIANYMMKNTPNRYRRNDILFNKGSIYWQMGKDLKKEEYFAKAFNTWKQISALKRPLAREPPAQFQSYKTYSKIRTVLKDFKNYESLGPLKFIITGIIANQHKEAIDKKMSREKRLLYP